MSFVSFACTNPAEQQAQILSCDRAAVTLTRVSGRSGRGIVLWTFAVASVTVSRGVALNAAGRLTLPGRASSTVPTVAGMRPARIVKRCKRF
jgi:hypothetical protein